MLVSIRKGITKFIIIFLMRYRFLLLREIFWEVFRIDWINNWLFLFIYCEWRIVFVLILILDYYFLYFFVKM